MKKIYQYIAILFVGMAVLGSCADDHEIQIMEQKIESAAIKLNFQAQSSREVVNSRATDAENKLYDLHFYVFSAKDKSLTGYAKLVSESGDLETPGPAGVEITAKTGESYIYAVANINKSSTYYLNADDKALLNVTDVASSSLNLDDFLAIRFNRRFGTEGSELFSPDPVDNVFMMSGYLNDGNPVTIQKDASGSVYIAEGTDIVKLYRILAKNTFTITSNVTSGKFTPKYYRLCNVPTSGMLIPEANISDVTSYTNGNTTDANVESSYRWNFEGASEITFFYPENLQIAKSGAKIGTWKERETNTWSNNVKTFDYADDDAAYIEIYGDYIANSGKVTANVSYTIHFGDFSNSGSLYDYNVVRNHAYTYAVTVKGVDDIEVEAKGQGNNPYAEGLIIEAEGGVAYNVDAHYEARVMAFSKASIQALKAANSDQPGYIVNVKTPFGETNQAVYVKADGVYNISGVKLCGFDNVSSIFTGETDYQWMKFVRNTNDNRMSNGLDISKYPCKYPGDNSSDCLNVFELLAELYDENNYDAETIYYTCFVDENYYASKSWPKYVNQDPRVMLIANDLNVSIDGKSLYAKVAYSISQRSISTFYVNTYSPNGRLVKAFGTEIIDEEKLYDARLSNSNYGTISDQDDWNAWTSANNTHNKKDWYSSMVSKEGIQPLYTTVAKACMSRNRDLDGDGKINNGEVRWYLAAVDQYRALFFGQNTLNPDAYLITREELEEINDAFNGNWGTDSKGHSYRRKYHYFSSSSGDKATFWPEEGLTNNPYNNNYSWAELVRCVRTLESEGNGLSDPERFYTYADNTFELGGIVATRNYTEVPLEGHNEIESANNLYSSFVMAKNDLINSGNNYNFDLEDVTADGSDLCSNYSKQNGVVGTDEANYSWRTPNQKEFALMVSKLGNHRYGMRTRFSGDDKANGYWNWHTTPGFWSDSGGGGRINVGTGYEGGVRIRCVRDKK